MNAVVKMPGKGIALRLAKAGVGLALINDTLADFVEPLRIADECRRQLQQSVQCGGFEQYLGGENSKPEAKFLDRAKVIHDRLLRNVVVVRDAQRALLQVVVPSWRRDPITHAQATAMLGVLFGTLNKKRADDENSATLLASCADMFNPVNDAIGTATGLWKPIAKHPLVLSIAIKQLIATSVFTPSPAELREALKQASERIRLREAYARQWLELVDRADALVFAFDRAGWDAAYSKLDSKAALYMTEGAELEDSPRLAALEHLCDDTDATEEEGSAMDTDRS